jgi:hypothetical protein
VMYYLKEMLMLWEVMYYLKELLMLLEVMYDLKYDKAGLTPFCFSGP